MKVIACQLDIVWEDKPANHAKVTRLLEHAAPPAGSLVVLPEMFATGFSMRAAQITDSVTQETQRFLSDTAKDFGVFLLGGVVSSGQSGLGRNECVGYNPAGEEIVRYCKIHPFTYGGEAQHYEAGTEVVLFDWAGFKVAPFICYDLRFPEIFRAAVKRGANLFTVMANWPVTRIAHWNALLPARAIENQAYVVGVNRCGDDPGLRYSGQSQVVAPQGDLLIAAESDETTIEVELSLDVTANYRRVLPFLADQKFSM